MSHRASSSDLTRLRVGVVLGTRPEAIKLAPLVLALRESAVLEPVVISTGQHREMVGPLLAGFGVLPDLDLDLMAPGQSLTDLAGRAVRRLGEATAALELDLVVVQGDTTTSMAGALAGFYSGVKVVHLEAGLRTDDRYSPYPEEVNRRLATQLADLHLAPTDDAGRRLLDEGVDPDAVVVTGNTVVDALLETARRDAPYAGPEAARLRAIDPAARVVLVTAHRRESWGEGVAQISRAVRDVVEAHPDVVAVFPLHPNPLVRDVALAELGEHPRVVVTDPLPYADLVRLLRHSELVITDSGGIQEEACSLGTPTLVTRETTERPEGLQAGGLRLVGTDRATIVEQTTLLLRDPAAREAMVCRSLPFGDGRAAQRSVAAIERFAAAALAAPDGSARVTQGTEVPS